MLLKKEDIKKMVCAVAALFYKNNALLSEIDSRFGDGDHGVTIKKIAARLEACASEWQDEPIGEFFDDAGTAILGVNGGSAGPLYGTMISGFGAPAMGIHEIDAVLLKKMFQGALLAMTEISTARVGDKTMMDALIPAVDAAQAASGGVEGILARAAEAAAEGAKDSEQYVSKFGRAKSYKEQTIGTPDAGAVSTSLFFEGLAAPFMAK